MNAHLTDAFVVTCIDFRFQKYIEFWLHKTPGEGKYDRVAWAGGVFDLPAILKQLEISDRLHKIKKVFLMNHEDCGAYGEAGTFDRHTHDLLEAKKVIEKLYPHLKVNCYYIRLSGDFEEVT
jgi:carbonic anhydrase